MVGCEIKAERQDSQDFFNGIIPSDWIGTVVAHVLLSPMKLVGAAVSKTASASSTPALGDAQD